jgi:nucleotide-binding universal stress UspA family protein
MRLLIYAGPAPSRDKVLTFSAPLVQRVASAVALVSGGGEAQRPLLADAAQRLAPPAGVSVTLLPLPGNANAAILRAAAEGRYDLAIFGRLRPRIRRLLPGGPGKLIARRLEPSVLRVQGAARPIHRMLLASGGDQHTFASVEMATQLASPLGASVTLLHVISQQSIVFEGFSPRPAAVERFLNGPSPEAATLLAAQARLEQRGVAADVRVRIGPVLDEILAELRDGYDLLVIGAHRVGSALDRLLLEDITGDLLDVSPVPVLVVKRRAVSDGGR